ncbi:MAG: hypothetical protein WEB06_16625 [Actinomycetota bacterium]
MEAVAHQLPTNGRLRSKQVTWEDPMALAAEARGMSGLEFLRSMIEGRLPRPPIASLLGFTLVDVGEGWAVFEGEVGEEHYNPIGVVHGGYPACWPTRLWGVRCSRHCRRARATRRSSSR